MRRILGRCAAPGCLKRAVHAHHVVYEQEVERRNGNKQAAANFLPLCLKCHFNHHGCSRKLPVTCLPDEALDFAFALLGAYAGDYLRRRYAGGDARLEQREMVATAIADGAFL